MHKYICKHGGFSRNQSHIYITLYIALFLSKSLFARIMKISYIKFDILIEQSVCKSCKNFCNIYIHMCVCMIGHSYVICTVLHES